MDFRSFDRRALDLTGSVVVTVKPGDLDRPTPCPGWTVEKLLRHMVSQNQRFAAAARGTDPDAAAPLDGGEIGEDPALAFRESADVVTEAFAAPDLEQRQVALPELSTPVPGPRAVAFHFVDYLVHAWDVAVSVGTAIDPPADLTEQALRIAERIPEAARAPGGAFGPRFPLPSSAPAFHRLLGLAGRDPGWTP